MYLAADLALPSLSGAFVFDPDDSVELVQGHRFRAVAEVLAMPELAPDPYVSSLPRLERSSRSARAGRVSVRASIGHRARAVADPASRSADDPH